MLTKAQNLITTKAWRIYDYTYSSYLKQLTCPH